MSEIRESMCETCPFRGSDHPIVREQIKQTVDSGGTIGQWEPGFCHIDDGKICAGYFTE